MRVTATTKWILPLLLATAGCQGEMDVFTDDITTPKPGITIPTRPDPGTPAVFQHAKPTLRRLTSSEYRNTVQDVLGAGYMVPASLPQDASTNGWMSIAMSSISVSQSGVDKYEVAAFEIAEHVIGIEMQPDAVENARRNAAHNGITNIEFHLGDVGTVLSEMSLTADVVVVDPPRSGLNPLAREMVELTGASRMVYVSCNPASLARDLAGFHKTGWKTLSVEPIDMFPHTYHIENVAVLER